MTKGKLSIYGVGLYFPDHSRKNDWWPKATVDSWQKPVQRPVDQQRSAEIETAGALAVKQAMAAAASDPFRGAVERRVLDSAMKTSDAEREAIEDGLRVASVDRKKIDFILCQSAIPDFLHQENAVLLHHQVGLRRDAFALSTEGMCNAFSQQLQLAAGFISSGRAQFGLLVQSSTISKTMRQEDYFSPWFGDAATCVVVGPARDGGFLGAATITDGSIFGSMVSGVPQKQWYEGASHPYVHDTENARQMFLQMPEHCVDTVGRALKEAGRSKADVAFWACHQATPWLPRVMKDYVGLTQAKTLSTFAWTASLIGSNIPFLLRVAVNEGMIGRGDLIATFAGASGVTGTSLVMEWDA